MILVLGSLAGLVSSCQTTGNSTLNTFQTISHKDSEVTVISNTFQVGRVRRKETLSLKIDFVDLYFKSKKLGGIELQTSSGQYCGFSNTSVDNDFKPDGYIKGLLEKTGTSGPVNSTLLKTKHGAASYLDLKGNGLRCIVTSQLVGAVSGATCSGGGKSILRVVVCSNSREGKENLDQKVLSLIDNLRVDGSGKSLIKEASTAPTSRQSSSSKGLDYCLGADGATYATSKTYGCNKLGRDKRVSLRNISQKDYERRSKLKFSKRENSPKMKNPPQSKASIQTRLKELKN